MNKRVIAVACDHAGLELKTQLVGILKEHSDELLDLGTHTTDSVDYPDFANAVAESIQQGKAQYGVLICGSGIGMSIAANRHASVRAALCQDGLSAALSRKHNNANVLCLGGRIIGIETAKDCVRQFFTTEFEGGRHEKRVRKLEGV